MDNDGNVLETKEQFISQGANVYRHISTEIEVVNRDAKFAVLYVANESRTDVYFDDLAIKHDRLVWQENNYYPFGLAIKPLDQEYEGASKFKYNGKEYQEELGWSDHGARMNDHQIARWNGVDALAEKYSGVSPYIYTLNNPIRYVDPDGNVVRDANNNIIITPNPSKPSYASAITTTVYEKDGKIYQVSQIVKYDNVYIYADNGEAIEATLFVGAYEETKIIDGDEITVETVEKEVDASKFDCSTNCHGVTFANGVIRIGDDQVAKLLKADKYKRTKEKKSDAVVFYPLDDDTEETNHSAKRNDDGTYDSNDGDSITLYGTDLNTARRGRNINKKRDQFYRKKRSNRVVNTNLGKVKGGKRIITKPKEIKAFFQQLNGN